MDSFYMSLMVGINIFFLRSQNLGICKRYVTAKIKDKNNWGTSNNFCNDDLSKYILQENSKELLEEDFKGFMKGQKHL